MKKDYELYDPNNKDHNNRKLYKVVEYESDGRHPNNVKCGDIISDAQRR